MADTATATPKPKAVKKPTKPKKDAAHPKYSEMIAAAVAGLKERSGSSRQAILKYIQANYKVGESANTHLKVALKSGVKAGTLKQAKGTGASGSFKLGEKPKVAKKATMPKAAKPKVKKAAVKKTVAKKPAAKKPAAKKPAVKKVKTPKKAAPKPMKAAAKPKKAAAKPKKAATKSPKKAKAAKPKKVKTPKKAAAKK